MPVKNRIREYREERGWSQSQLARKSGVGRSTISEAETGGHIPSLEAALRLARTLERAVDELFRLAE